MAEFVYVDNSNVFIEGKRVSAVEKGLAMNIFDAMNNKVIDNAYRLDFGKLHNFVAGNDLAKIKRATLFGSRPPQNDSLWQIARNAGFETIVEDRNVSNKEKKVDTGIVSVMARDAYRTVDKAGDVLTLVAGDADFVPPVRMLIEDGYRVEVVFWEHAAKELKEVCSKFISLNPFLAVLSF